MPHALIIDDDHNNLSVLEQLLMLQEISYTSVNDSRKVEETLSQNEKIDVVLLDLGMPNLNGYQVLEIINQYPQMKDVPVVACTVDTHAVQTARRMGFHSFISKPLDIDRFSDQLARILNGQSVWQAY
jgi:two-component system, cell cycle response regulator DivK